MLRITLIATFFICNIILFSQSNVKYNFYPKIARDKMNIVADTSLKEVIILNNLGDTILSTDFAKSKKENQKMIKAFKKSTTYQFSVKDFPIGFYYIIFISNKEEEYISTFNIKKRK